MEFRDYAAKETSALLAKLRTSQAETALHHLRTLQASLDAAARSVEADGTDSQAEQEIQELVRRLNTAASAAARAASQKVQKEAQTALDAVNEELKAQREHNDKLAAAASDARAQADVEASALRADLQKEKDRADAADRDLDAAIEAHAQVDAARVEAEANLRQQTQARSAAEKDLVEVRALLDQTVADAARLTGERDTARQDAAALTSEVEAARAEVEKTRQDGLLALDSAKRALESERDQTEQLANSLAEAQAQAEMSRADVVDAQAQIESLKTLLAKESERADTSDRDLDAAIEAHAAVDAARLEAEASARREAQARAELQKELAEARSLLDASVAQVTRLNMQLENASSETRTLNADLTAARAEIESAHKQREAAAAQLEATRLRVQTLERNQSSNDETIRRLESSLNDAIQSEATARELAAGTDADVARALADMAALRGEVDRMGSLLDASTQSIDEMAASTTIGDLLASLVRQLSVEFSRVALFRVKGNRLEGEYQIGFDDTTDITKLVLPLNVDSLITRAAGSGMVEHLKGHELDDSSRAPFGGSPTSAMALPVAFQGETIAVVYADSDQIEREGQPFDGSAAFARLMVKATTVLLMRLSQELKTLNELREYAAMLLQEAEEMYTADQQTERSEDERRSRLQDTMDCARQLYAQRAALEGAAAATLLDDRIAALLQGELTTPFARDLAAIAGRSGFGDSRQTAAS
jgi:chromosome segregation ATPase